MEEIVLRLELGACRVLLLLAAGVGIRLQVPRVWGVLLAALTTPQPKTNRSRRRSMYSVSSLCTSNEFPG